MTSTRPIEIIGAPFDWGASIRGCRLGPDALRALGLLERLRESGHDVLDGGNVTLPPLDWTKGNPPKLKHLAAVQAVCEALAERVESALQNGRLPVVIGGDHAIAMGTIGGAARVHTPLGVIWVDAHGDINDSTSTPSGNIHGMPVAGILGMADPVLNDIAGVNPKVRPEHLVLIGVRDVDPEEKPRLEASGATVFSAWDVQRRGIETVIAEAIQIAGNGTAGVHLSFDLDAIEPDELMGTGTRAPGGLTFREASVLVRDVWASGRMTSFEVTELNPLLDQEARSSRLALKLICYALGITLS